jgi:hypothetical protein
VAGGAGIGGTWNGTFGIVVGTEGMLGIEGIGGNAVGIVIGIFVGIVVGILGTPGIAGIGGSVVGIVTFGIEGIGGKVVGIAGIVGLGVVGADSGAAASVVSKNRRAAKLPLMAVKAKSKARIGQI